MMPGVYKSEDGRYIVTVTSDEIEIRDIVTGDRLPAAYEVYRAWTNGAGELVAEMRQWLWEEPAEAVDPATAQRVDLSITREVDGDGVAWYCLQTLFFSRNWAEDGRYLTLAVF